MIQKLSENDVKTVENILSKEFHTSFPQENPFIQWYIWKENGLIGGFISYSIMYENLELNYIYVDPKFRKKNIASELMLHMVKEAQAHGVEVLTLEVRETNIIAQKLYHKFGFCVAATRKNYYGKENGLLMVRKLI